MTAIVMLIIICVLSATYLTAIYYLEKAGGHNATRVEKIALVLIYIIMILSLAGILMPE